VEGTYYLLLAEGGCEIQAEGQFLQLFGEQKPQSENPRNRENDSCQFRNSMPSDKRAGSDQVAELLKTFQETLVDMCRLSYIPRLQSCNGR